MIRRKLLTTQHRDDIKSCEKFSIINSFKIRGREGVRPGGKFKRIFNYYSLDVGNLGLR